MKRTREIRKFHVVVVLRRLRNIHKGNCHWNLKQTEMNSGSCSQMTSSWKWPIERRSVTSRYHGRKISGWRRQRERQKSNRFILTTQQLCTCVTLLYISLPSLHDCDNHMKLPYFTRPLYGVGDHNTKNVLFRNIDTVLLDLTSEKFANIW